MNHKAEITETIENDLEAFRATIKDLKGVSMDEYHKAILIAEINKEIAHNERLLRLLG